MESVVPYTPYPARGGITSLWFALFSLIQISRCNPPCPMSLHPSSAPPFQDTTKRISAMQTQVRQETAKRTGDEQRMSHPLVLVRDITLSSHTEGHHTYSPTASEDAARRPQSGLAAGWEGGFGYYAYTPLPAVEPLAFEEPAMQQYGKQQKSSPTTGRSCRQQTPVPINTYLSPAKDKSFLGGEDFCLHPSEPPMSEAAYPASDQKRFG